MFTKLVNYRNSIRVYYSKDKKVLRLKTGVVIEKANEFSDGRFTARSKDQEGYTRQCGRVQQQVEEVIDQYFILNRMTPPVGYVEMVLHNEKGKVTQGNKAIDLYGEFYQSKVNSAIQRPSLRDYKSLEHAMKLYEYLSGRILTLDQINTRRFFQSFEKFLSTRHELTSEESRRFKTEGGLNHNTLAKRLSGLRSFMSWCQEQGYIETNELRYAKKKTKKYIPTIVTLTEDELISLKELELKGKEERIRDIFLFLSLTGLRYSDARGLNKHHIQNGVISKVSQKTADKFEVPLTKTALSILVKYDFNLNRYSSQKFNTYIKELLKKYEICQYQVQIVRMVGNTLIEEEVPKYQLIHSHTGRKIFISRCVQNNIPINQIQKMTGHKQLGTILHYLDVFGVKNIGMVEKLEIK